MRIRLEFLSVEEQARRDRLQDRLRKIYELANEKFHREFPFPEVSYDLSGNVAGKAYYRENLIKINAEALARFERDTIEDTLPHEVAHLIAFQIYGGRIKPHGWEWKRVAWNLGCSGDRCHSLPLTPAKVTRKFLYRCFCMRPHEIGLNVHRKIQLENSKRICVRCRAPIVFLEEK